MFENVYFLYLIIKIIITAGLNNFNFLEIVVW